MQRAAKDQSAATIAFVNDETSPLARGAGALLCLHAGPERSVAATKSMIASLVASASLVAHWSEDNELLDALALSCLRFSTYRPPRRLPRRRSRRWPKRPPCSLSGGAPRTPSLPRRRSSSRKLRRFMRKHSRPPKCCTGRRASSGQGFRSSPSRPRTPPVPVSSKRSIASLRLARSPLVVDVEPHERWRDPDRARRRPSPVDPDRGASRLLPRRRGDRAPARP